MSSLSSLYIWFCVINKIRLACMIDLKWLMMSSCCRLRVIKTTLNRNGVLVRVIYRKLSVWRVSFPMMIFSWDGWNSGTKWKAIMIIHGRYCCTHYHLSTSIMNYLSVINRHLISIHMLCSVLENVLSLRRRLYFWCQWEIDLNIFGNFNLLYCAFYSSWHLLSHVVFAGVNLIGGHFGGRNNSFSLASTYRITYYSSYNGITGFSKDHGYFKSMMLRFFNNQLQGRTQFSTQIKTHSIQHLPNHPQNVLTHLYD